MAGVDIVAKKISRLGIETRPSNYTELTELCYQLHNCVFLLSGDSIGQLRF
jgi:hypothetical protein